MKALVSSTGWIRAIGPMITAVSNGFLVVAPSGDRIVYEANDSTIEDADVPTKDFQSGKYLLVDGAVELNPDYTTPPSAEQVIGGLRDEGRDEIRVQAAKLIRADELTAEELADAVNVFPRWRVGIAYTQPTTVSHNGKLYRLESAHTSQSDWEPGVAHSLWTEIAPPGVIAAWVQPQGAHDSYPLGAKVTHNGQVWVSIHDGANSWEPGVYGWEIDASP